MTNSVEARRFTDTLLSTVRLQRHLGVRVVISTQEPTISSDLLSLCSVVIVHRFSSPAWLHSLKSHVAAAALEEQSNVETAECGDNIPGNTKISKGVPMFNRIVQLRVGEALILSPSAMLGIPAKGSSPSKVERLGTGYLVIKVRERLTEDGGKSVVSSGE